MVIRKRYKQDQPQHETVDDAVISGAGSGGQTATHALAELDRERLRLDLSYGPGVLERNAMPRLAKSFAQEQQKLANILEGGEAQAHLVGPFAASVMRGWLALEAQAKRDGLRPRNDAVWVGLAPGGEQVCVYTGSAALGDVADYPCRFHIDELVALVPAKVLELKTGLACAVVGNRSLPDDDMPF